MSDKYSTEATATDSCSACGSEQENLLQCSSCKSAKYCNNVRSLMLFVIHFQRACLNARSANVVIGKYTRLSVAKYQHPKLPPQPRPGPARTSPLVAVLALKASVLTEI